MTTPHAIFGRKCRVTVGTLGVETLRVGFTIEKTLKPKEPNTCELAVYNLSLESRQQLERFEKSIPVEIFAGYDGTGTSLLFRGELRECFSRPEQDGSWVTIVRSGDGDKGLRTSATTRGYRPGVSLERVISDLAKDLGVGVGNIGKTIKTQLASGTLSLEGIGSAFTTALNGSGSAAERLDRAMRSAGLEWSVQDGEIQSMAHGQPAQRKITVLTPANGLEGTPEIEARSKKKETAKTSVSFRARIVPDLMPGYVVQLKSSTVTGLYRIERVRFVGDTHGADWGVECVATETGVSL